MSSAAQCARHGWFGRTPCVRAGAALTAVLLGGILGLTVAPRARACSFGPTYNECMQQEQEQQQQRQREEQQEQMRAEQERAQQQQQAEQQRMEQQRQLQEQQEQQRRAQQQQAVAQRPSAARPEVGVPREPTPERTEPRPRIGVPRQPMAGRPGSGSLSPRSGAAPLALSRAGSQAVLNRVNSARVGLTGINRRPIPPGVVTQHPNGVLSVSASGGRHFTLGPNGTLRSLSVHGQVASFRADGRLARLHTARMDVVYSPHGARTVVVHGPNHRLIVSTGPHRGYVQRDVILHGRRFVERTVIVGRVRTVRLYGTYTFHGVALTYYVPHYYYAPAFYGWAYYPWVAPVAYAWPWVAAPWYATYGTYFVVSPVYVGPYDWLTDYYLSQTLAEEYAAQAAAAQAASAQAAALSAPLDSSQSYADGAPDGSSPGEAYAAADAPITPEIKQAIAQEVRQQLAADNGAAAAPGGAPGAEGEAGATPDAAAGNLSQALQPHHVFVVDADLSATTADEEACNLSAGNVLEVAAVPAVDSAVADLTVMSSKRTDCPAGTHVTLSIDSLAEMQNAFSARLDDGLAALHQQQGQNGIPAAPPSAIAPPPRPTDYPPPDGQDAAAMLDSAQQQANQAAASVTAQAFAANTDS